MPRPNILFLLTDQQRYDAVGCNADNQCRTPAIDEVAASGTQFTRAYTPIALCTPARASLLTGRYPHNHGQLSNMGNFNGAFDDRVLDHVEETYPRLLQRAGYEVRYAGKWHLPEQGNEELWGIDEWHTNGDWQASLSEKGIDYRRGRDDVQRLEWGGDAPFCGPSTLSADDMQEAWVADRTIELIEERANADEPFAMCTSFFGPHFPYAVPEPYDELYDPDRIDRPENFDEDFEGKPDVQEKEQLRWNASHLTWSDWQEVIAHYWGYCTFIDDQIRRILEGLDECDMADDTIVVITSDHGDLLGNHRLFNKGFVMYEETHHVPLVARWPDEWGSGTECDEFVNLVDVMPTFLDAAGVDVPDEVDGRSLTPLLRGERPADWRDDVYAEFHGYEPSLYTSRMVRTDDWKYVYNPGSRDELYDLDSDPGELENLADRTGFEHVLRRLQERLVTRMRETDDAIASEDGWKGTPFDLYVSERER